MATSKPTPPEPLQADHPLASILETCWRRLNRENEHWMHCMLGREGSGKSLTAVRLGNLIDPSFSADRVFFEPAKLLEILEAEEFEQGDVYVVDEAGVGLGKRSWQDTAQVKTNQALQLIRSHNIGVIFTLPRLSELDSQTQGRLHSYFEIAAKEPDEYVRGRWRWLDPDRIDITDEIYHHSPAIRGQKVKTVDVGPPQDDELVANYTKKKETFQKEFYAEVMEEVGVGDDEEEEEIDPQGAVDQILKEDRVDEFIEEVNGGAQTVLSKDLIAAEFGFGRHRGKQAKKLLKREIDREVI